MFAIPAERARSLARASITAEMSTPSTLPRGPTRSASASVVVPQPQPTSIARSPAASSARSIASTPNGSIVASMRSCSATHFAADGEFQYSICSALGPVAAIVICTPHGLRSLLARCAQLAAPRPEHRSEAREVLRVLLAVDQVEAPAHELPHQRDERDLRCVGLAREHRLAEEDAAERHAVEAAD